MDYMKEFEEHLNKFQQENYDDFDLKNHGSELDRDDDEGDQTGVGGPEDENVKGTLTSAIYYRRATGSNVEVTAPSVSTGGTNSF